MQNKEKIKELNEMLIKYADELIEGLEKIKEKIKNDIYCDKVYDPDEYYYQARVFFLMYGKWSRYDK